MALIARASGQPTPPAGRPSAAAADYDAWFQAPWGRYAFAVESAAVLQAAGALDGAQVLDAGCGTGRFTGALERAGASVVGVDIDPGMLAAAANLAGPRLVAEAYRLPFATGAFDLIVALTLLEFVDDPAGVVAELARVTRPGGRLLIAALNRASPWGLAHRRRLRRPPWRSARFLTRGRLRTLGRAHGTARLQAALYAPAAFLGLSRVGPLLEALGPPLAGRLPAPRGRQELAMQVTCQFSLYPRGPSGLAHRSPPRWTPCGPTGSTRRSARSAAW